MRVASQRPGALKTGTVKTGTLKTGTVKTGTLKTGTLKTGTLKTGTAVVLVMRSAPWALCTQNAFSAIAELLLSQPGCRGESGALAALMGAADAQGLPDHAR